MAKESMKAREVKRAKLVARYAEKRAALKKVIATTEDPSEAYEAARKLQAIPKNANPIRLHNRCKITGRPKGYKMTDPIADFLTRLRNAIMAHHRVVEVPASNLKKEITKILFEKGYILNYKFVEDGPQGTIKVALKYDPATKTNAITTLKRVSTPGLRKYVGYKDMPRVINGLGIAILSTSKGVMTDKEASAQKIGGEVLCYVY